ncbi:FAD-dependent oxidoreductase, partial [Candidatus Deferrimicrobium sp.]|uniref:FAD-dependent oxidoreductase n=1 Tax=Candidatus Deferrimicrobium sp. TaxID=3060586 RepID=UPI003C55C1D4
SHGGRRAGRVSKAGYLDVTRGAIPIAPSSIPHPVPGFVVPRELSREGIAEMVVMFGNAARRAVEAGFDVVGLHCAHMYLCGEFLSPWANRRTDEYGGNAEKRMRFVAEVVGAMRKTIGPGVPLLVRMNGEEPEGGNTLDEIAEIARRIEGLGAAAISVSVGFGAPIRSPGFIPSVAPMRAPDGCIVSLAENIKKAVSIPVMVSNKIVTLEFAERILSDGKADLIGLGRPLIADPHLPEKGRTGRHGEIVPCIYCGQGCIQNVLEHDAPVACTVNPRAGKEELGPGEDTARPKEVVVVGGGPGGLTAARILARRGHRVTLYERGPSLGGQLLLASVPPGKRDVRRLTGYLVEEVRKAGVAVRLGEEPTPEALERAEVVVVATGVEPVIPAIPGVDRVHVVTARDILSGKATAGSCIVVVGGGQVGAEVAEYLAEQGRTVTVLEILDEPAKGMAGIARIPLLCRLEELGVAVWTMATVLEIREKDVLARYRGEESAIPADTVVIAAGARSNAVLYEKIKGTTRELHLIGDARGPKGLLEAIADGFEVGKAI